MRKPKLESDDELRCCKRARGKRSDSKTTVTELIEIFVYFVIVCYENQS
jgi:hypothetical protein